MSLPQDREVMCRVCERWTVRDRVGYVLADQYESRHAYPLCPQCQALATFLAFWSPPTPVGEIMAMAQAVRASQGAQATVAPRLPLARGPKDNPFMDV